MNATASKRGERPTRRPARLLVAIGALAMIGSLGPAGAQDLVRAEFQHGDEVFRPLVHLGAGVYDDGDFVICGDPGVQFSYADATDIGETGCLPVDPGTISILSGGGAWRLSGMNSEGNNRTLSLMFRSESASPGACEALILETRGEGDCECDVACEVHVWVGPDRLFKKKASRQSLGGRFDIFEGDGGPIWRVNWIDPLYLCPDPGRPTDSSRRVMQSIDCDYTVGTDVSRAEVVLTSDNSSIGEWNLPIQILAQRVSPPPDDPGDPPGSCTLPLLPKGAPCTSGSECCSKNCKGGRNKTCK